jgi:calcium/calmodulin-dependent 3',5'-cyclic nucleotide phosphodiesterase
MSRHNEFIIKLSNFNFERENFTVDEEIFIMSSILHSSDLSNSLKDFEFSFEWSKRISLEFYEQTVKEEIEGLSSLSFMKVHDDLTMCLNEITFITNISIPMWDLVKRHIPRLEILFNKCQNTLKKWKEIETKYIQENDINTFNY